MSDHIENNDNETENYETEVSSRDISLAGTAVTVGVVAIGAAVFEAALIPGMILGVAAVAVPSIAPKVGSVCSPMFRSIVRGAYMFGRKTKEMAAQAQEHIDDVVGEAKAEDQTSLNANKAA